MSEEIIITTIYEIPGIEICIKEIISEAVEGTDVEQLIKKLEERVKEKDLDGIVGLKIVSAIEDGKVKLIGFGSGFKIIKSQWAVY
ncbi:selenium-binding protein [Methanocaldococcus fervens]|uniref:Uncharacterized protein n=1 Tax=Methanocaldococcus fervens (strain DSM 4213 / JCM 15782 / AG86) TaxID=573064 RepID=C7P7D6_METFA|nr:selenium-binding protein [Methanocaldococcus fervens]ACV24468.1 hypothetical protein Mefer_0649 [Methanocaldococcus fervens AG86]